jgi:undecaprenyl-diphosphatase
MMNFLNQAIYSGVNGLAQLSPLVEKLMLFLESEPFLKGGVMMAMFWWFWFTPDEKGEIRSNRETILAILFGGCLAILLARILAVTLPFELRPISAPGFSYRLPIHQFPPAFPMNWETWSAFPSDHAALFTALAAGFWFFSRPLAGLMIVYAVILIFLPRIYLGLHYPVDIMAGMIIGICALMLANICWVKNLLTKPLINWSENHPASFYSMFFVYSYQLVVLFDPVRHIGRGLWKIFRGF